MFVAASGVFLTTARALGVDADGAAPEPGCALPGAPGFTLLARDVVAGWALVRAPRPSTPDAVRLIAEGAPRTGARVSVVGGDGTVESEAPGLISLRLDPGVTTREGEAVLDGSGRVLGVVLDVRGAAATAVPAALARVELRGLSTRGALACPPRRAARDGARAPRVPAASSVDPLAIALARAATVVRADGAERAVLVGGAGLALLPSESVGDVAPGCGLPLAAPWGAATLVEVDAAAGLAVLRAFMPGVRAALAVRAAPLAVGEALTLVTPEGSVAATVAAEGSDLLRVTLASEPRDGLAGLPLIDGDGRLAGIARAGHGRALMATPTPRLPQVLDHAARARTPPCVPARAEPAAASVSLPPMAVYPVDARGSLAVHVASDGVYATLADRLQAVSSGCIVRREQTLGEARHPLAGEVLDVDAAANLAVYRVVRAPSSTPPPTPEAPPLVLASARPVNGATAFIATQAFADATTLTATVSDVAAEDFWLALSAAAEALRIPAGAAVLDAQGHVLGLIDRVDGRRAHARAAASLRALVAGLRRDQATPTCFPTYGASQGPVVAVTVKTGFALGTHDVQGPTYDLSVGVLFFDTWYARGDVGARLDTPSALHLAAAGGPLLFRSPGDGAVGVGLHLEAEAFNGRSDARSNGAQRALYGLEVMGTPYFGASVGLTATLALGLAQYGDFREPAFAFGASFQLGLAFGALRRDR